jgi:HK97 family phage major capsid protein
LGSVYQRIRQASDTNGRPLLSFRDGSETLFGAPIFISPSLGVVGGSIGLSSELIWGDLSAFHIRMSKPVISRSINSSIVNIESGRALYTCRARVDSVYLDPSSGASPAIVIATVTA